MSSALLVLIILLQILVLIVLLYGAYRLYELYRSSTLDRRFGPYTLETLEEDYHSFGDSLINNFIFLRNNFSKFLIKLKIFNAYSNHYEKYCHQSQVNDVEKMNHISNKFFVAGMTILLLLLSLSFHYQKIDIGMFLIIFVIGFFLYDLYLLFKEKMRKNRIEKDMSKAIIIMNNAFKSGYSIMQAVYLVSTELDGAISSEFRKMYLDISFGLNMETVFSRFAKRVPCIESKYMEASLAVVNKTGGNIIQVFNAVERNAMIRKKLKQELESTAAASRAMFKLLVFIPVCLVLILLLLNPSYFNVLFTTPIGIVCLILSLLLYVLYIIIIKKIIYVEVRL